MRSLRLLEIKEFQVALLTLGRVIPQSGWGGNDVLGSGYRKRKQGWVQY